MEEVTPSDVAAPSGAFGSIYMSNVDDKLYFKNSSETFDLTASGSSSLWTEDTNGISYDDNVGIGDVSDGNTTLYVTTSTDGDAIWAANSKTSGIGVHSVASGSSGYAGYFNASGTTSIGVYGSGSSYDFYAAGSGTDYGSSSSIRWKENVININNPIKKIMKLDGVYFDWKESHGGKHDVGFIAESVGKVLPEIVDYEENGIDAIGLDYSKLTPLLVESVKYQQKQIRILYLVIAIMFLWVVILTAKVTGNEKNKKQINK